MGGVGEPVPVAASALLVSQDTTAIQQISESMQQLAMAPEICPEIPDALRLLGHRKFDAIIVDLQLGEPAQTFLGQVRSSSSNRTAVTFAISNSEKEKLPASEAGAHFVLERPLSLASIDRTLKAAYGMIIRERRRYFRCPITIPADIRQDMQEVHGQTVNISEGGMAISIPVPLRAGVPATVRFTLPGKESQFAAQSEICWYKENGRAGLQFRSLSQPQKSELQEWLSRRLEESLPESVAEKFRKANAGG
jgi:CheY-like chemotaxis protein